MPTTSAARRALEIVRIIDAGDRTAARAYVAEAFAPAFRDRAPLAAHPNFVSSLHDNSRGVRLHSFTELIGG